MPTEIDIIPCGRYSPMSQVSGATDLIGEPPQLIGHSMMCSALPTLDTESASPGASLEVSVETASKKRKTRSPTHEHQINMFPSTASLKKRSPNKAKTRDLTHAVSDALVKAQNAQKPHSILTKSKRFQQLVKYTFDTVDTDKSGTIDENELYAGLLLIHLQLAAYAGPAACRPVTRENVGKIFRVLDWDQSGTLDQEEFMVAMTMLTSHILTRVIVQLCLTLALVPILAQYILDLSSSFAGILYMVDDAVHLTDNLYWCLNTTSDFFIPPGLKNFSVSAGEKMDAMIPDDVYDTLPMTIVSCILGMLLVPWMLVQIDGMYHGIAVRWKKKDKKKRD